jgi:4-hydroxy-tetrahydrodipicolinate synthase
MFKGSIVALVTPMQPNGNIDPQSLHDLIEWHISSKTDAISIVGTTGEASTLKPDEQFDIVSRVVKQVEKRVPVIAGTGTNSTQHTLELTLNAEKAGADAALIITPYCNKPSQKGLYQHYKLIAEKTALPIILYNVPTRTGCDLLPETIEQLSKIPNIIGIKEATGNVDRAIEILKRCGKKFEIYSGDDLTAMDLMLNGAVGVISVTANIAPRKMHDMCEAVLSGNKALAEKLNDELIPLHKNLFLESNPVPAKWALHQMGKIPPGIRLPLFPFDPKYHTELKNAMHAAGVV